jgi:hypothetical protein
MKNVEIFEFTVRVPYEENVDLPYQAGVTEQGRRYKDAVRRVREAFADAGLAASLHDVRSRATRFADEDLVNEVRSAE